MKCIIFTIEVMIMNNSGTYIQLEWIIEEGMIKLVVHSDNDNLDKVKECFDDICKSLTGTINKQIDKVEGYR